MDTWKDRAIAETAKPSAPHGFNADYRPSYRKKAAEEGMNRLLAWFRHHGAM